MMSSFTKYGLIFLAVIALTSVNAKAQQSANTGAQQSAECYEVVMSRNVAAPLGSIMLNKCTGDSWRLGQVAVSGGTTNRWFPITVEHTEGVVHGDKH